MSNFVYDLALNTKLAILMSASGISTFFIDMMISYDSFIVRASATVSFVTLLIVAAARYFKMLGDIRSAKEATRLSEIMIEKGRLESENLRLENELLKKKIDGGE